MTTWFLEYEVEINDEILKEYGIDAEEFEILEAIKSCPFVEDISFVSGLTKEKKNELDSLYTVVKRRTKKSSDDTMNE